VLTSLLPALSGVRVIEMEGIGPVPFAAMMLGDLGADVIRVRRPGRSAPAFVPPDAISAIGRHRCATLVLDAKDAVQGRALRSLIGSADVLIEGFRPGVMERMGLGPEACLRERPSLVYGRMSGWGQTGPWARRAGHDINFIAATGALHAIGRSGGPPAPPLSLVGDYGGGAMFLLVGVLAALLGARTTGRGRVVDAAIVDGVSLLLASVWGRLSCGDWSEVRGTNLLDGGAPFYDVYATLDGSHVAVGALEPQFFDALCRGLDLYPKWDASTQMDPARWPRMRADFERTFAARSRDHWTERFAGTDACVTPVLSLSEAVGNEHLRARGVLGRAGRVVTPAPAPRLAGGAPRAGFDEILEDLGVPGEVRRVLEAARADRNSA
jgi:alpha-methylacyl-CoA racemase